MATPVLIYSLSTCGVCKSVKRLLAERGVLFDAIDVDLLEEKEKAAAAEEVRRLNPRFSFPTTVIGTQVVVGFQKDQILKALELM